MRLNKLVVVFDHMYMKNNFVTLMFTLKGENSLFLFGLNVIKLNLIGIMKLMNFLKNVYLVRK